MIRLTGGARRGAKLVTPRGLATRPALARVRVCLFDVLADQVEGARVADLFAGSGALGLEALSRGAASCVFVEKSREAADAIERNLEKLKFNGRVIRGDVFGAEVPPSDLVFVDPPYALYREPARLAELLRRIDGELYIVEHPRGDPFAEGLPFLRRVDRRDFGRTILTFLKRLNIPAAPS
jgi:16S rRNA (guanine966-N2)-methyltransferase